MVNSEERNAKRRAYRAANPEKIREQERRNRSAKRDAYNASRQRWKKANPEKVRARHVKSKYGITQIEWNAQFAAQNYSCAVCLSEDPGHAHWVVDHCHKTNRLRGILCQSCNKGLGMFTDNPEKMRAAANYIETIHKLWRGE